MFVYCPHCGLITKKTKQNQCPVCEYEFEDVPDKYLTQSKNLFISQETRAIFIKEILETNPAYNIELSNIRNEILEEKEALRQNEISQKVEEYKKNRVVCKCPVCGSDNLSAISNTGKIIKIALIGVWGAGDLGKRRYCNSCGHRF